MEQAISVRGLKTFKLREAARSTAPTPARKPPWTVSFDVRRGEMSACSANGAGKTATLRMLAALVKPDEGDALIEVSAVADPMRVRETVGFLTSELKLEETFSPDYLFDFFSELRHLEPAVRDERKRALFGRFGIDRFAQTKIADLSTGMKQKASLAISLVHDPDVIIFDEPTNGLDVLTAKTVTDFLAELRGGQDHPAHAHFQPGREGVRPGQRDHRRADGGVRTLPELMGGRSLEDAFFDLYAARAGEAS
ncbi:MAG: ATP-binding cassette domain-containing protein [Eggerthellaceae bacterium]